MTEADDARSTVEQWAAGHLKSLINAGRTVGDDCDEVECRIHGDGTVEVTLTTMYEYVNLTFADMEKVSAFLGTKDINVDHDSEPGCDSCDYGSRYTVTLYAKHSTLGASVASAAPAATKAFWEPR